MTAAETLAWLEKTGTQKQIDSLSRYGIVANKPFGVPIGAMLQFAKKHGKDHALAAALWKNGRYEARLLASMLEDPKAVTPAQMKAWSGAFDNWGICDTVCWHVFDHTSHAWKTAKAWSRSPREYVKRAGFVMMAGQVARNKTAKDAEFLEFLPLIEKGALDERPAVQKSVSWALRRIGGKKALRAPCLALAKKLAASKDRSERWVGKDAQRYLERKKA